MTDAIEKPAADAAAPGDAPRSGPLLPDYRLQQRDYLLRITRAMSARLDLREVLALVIRSAVDMTGGQAGAIVMAEPDGTSRVVASYRLEGRLTTYLEPLIEPEAEDEGRPSPTEEREGAAELVRLGEKDAELAGRVLALPLETSGTVIGQIIVLRSEGAAMFSTLDSRLLHAFADQAAVAIQNARLHEQVAARERHLASIVENVPSGVALLDAAGRVVQCNAELEALTGRQPDELAGSRLLEQVPLVDDAGAQVAVELPDADSTTVVQGYARRPDGGRGAYVQLTIAALTDEAGRIERFVANTVDLSAFREAENAKRAFLAGLSHELKTPLALIRGYAETLRDRRVSSDEELLDESLATILDETEHLTAMVDQLLLAARLEAGALALDRHEVDLARLLERLVEQFRRAEPEHDWRLDLATDLPPVHADPVRLREVFQNLLGNAGKYSDAGTEVLVRAVADDQSVQICVVDCGIGIEDHDRERIFERFVRASDRAEGTGLGLYMSQAIVEAHGGSIGVESRPGHGSTFTVRLPLRPPGELTTATEAPDGHGTPDAPDAPDTPTGTTS